MKRERHDAAVRLVAAALDRWRLQEDSEVQTGVTEAEFVVICLEQERRLR